MRRTSCCLRTKLKRRSASTRYRQSPDKRNTADRAMSCALSRNAMLTLSICPTPKLSAHPHFVFGASDAPLKGEELDKFGLVQFPMVMGGIVPVVNIEGIKAGRACPGRSTLAAIFLGKVKSWDDPAIKKLNPNANLPAQTTRSSTGPTAPAPLSISRTIWRRSVPIGNRRSAQHLSRMAGRHWCQGQ